jgi:hypothetical protein
MTNGNKEDPTGLEALRDMTDDVLLQRLRAKIERIPDSRTVEKLRIEHCANIEAAFSSRGDVWAQNDVLVLRNSEIGDIEIPVDRLPVVLGREDEADVTIPHETISELHCRLQRSGTLAMVVDLQSKNGTFLQNRQVLQQDLCDGDCLQMGTLQFVVERM